MLLANDPEDDTAKGRIRMFLLHSSYFYFSAAGLIGRMQSLPPERRPVTPTVGQFHAELRAFGSLARCIVERTSCAAAREARFSAGRCCARGGIRSCGPDRF